MVPKIVKISEFRKNLAKHLSQIVSGQPVLLQTVKNVQYVVLDLDAYNKMQSFLDVYKDEDPEGKYKTTFIKEMKVILKNKHDIDAKVNSLTDLL